MITAVYKLGEQPPKHGVTERKYIVTKKTNFAIMYNNHNYCIHCNYSIELNNVYV